MQSPASASETLGKDVVITRTAESKPNQGKGKKRQKGDIACRFYQTSGGKWIINSNRDL
jgi:hypothetical protein